MAHETVLYTVSDQICTITLNRPERGNSMHKGMFGAIRAVWEDVRNDDSVRVVIVTGTGDRHFSTGADVGIAASDSSVAANAQLDQTMFWSALVLQTMFSSLSVLQTMFSSASRVLQTMFSSTFAVP